MSSCRKARGWILRARDGELGLDLDLRLQAHVADCDECAELWRRSAALEEAFTRLPQPPVESLDVGAAVARVRARCEADDARRRSGRRTLVRRLALAAALVLLVTAVALRPWRDAGTPRVGGAGPQLAQATEGLATESLPPETTPSDLAGALEVEDGLVVSLEPRPEPEPLDEGRIEDSRARVRSALAQAIESHPVEAGAEDFARELDERLRPLEREGWPVTRLVERFASDEEMGLAVGAVRYLGLRGDRLSARRLARLLEGRSTGADALALRRAVVFALADAGDDGLVGLELAARDPELAADVLQVALAVGGARAARRVVEVIETWVEIDGASQELDVALDGLARLGRPGFDALFGLAARRVLPRERVLAALEDVRGGRELVLERIAAGPARREVELTLAAAGRLSADAALPWIEERCLEREHRAAALACLVELGTSEALDVLFELRDGGRLAEDDVRASLARLEARRPGTTAGYVARLSAADDAAGLELVLSCLLEVEAPWAGSGLAALAIDPLLGEDERVWAALAVGEVDALDQLEDLSRALSALAPDSKRLAAAYLLSIHDLGAAPAVRGALRGIEPGRLEELLRLLERRSRERNLAAPMFKLARSLEPWLEAENPERRRTSP